MIPVPMAEDTDSFSNDGDSGDNSKTCSNNNFQSANKPIPLGKLIVL